MQVSYFPPRFFGGCSGISGPPIDWQIAKATFSRVFHSRCSLVSPVAFGSGWGVEGLGGSQGGGDPSELNSPKDSEVDPDLELDLGADPELDFVDFVFPECLDSESSSPVDPDVPENNSFIREGFFLCLCSELRAELVDEDLWELEASIKLEWGTVGLGDCCAEFDTGAPLGALTEPVLDDAVGRTGTAGVLLERNEVLSVSVEPVFEGCFPEPVRAPHI